MPDDRLGLLLLNPVSGALDQGDEAHRTASLPLHRLQGARHLFDPPVGCP